MAHTFFRGVVFLSGLVSGRFFAIRGGNLPVSGLESSQGSWWSREGMVPDGKMGMFRFPVGAYSRLLPRVMGWNARIVRGGEGVRLAESK